VPYAEGETSPKMMSVGLPRLQIAQHWHAHHMDLGAKAWDIG
jgi:hypothetical protein